jgi:hypothetical protein
MASRIEIGKPSGFDTNRKNFARAVATRTISIWADACALVGAGRVGGRDRVARALRLNFTA